jgi:hypothetical protein
MRARCECPLCPVANRRPFICSCRGPILPFVFTGGDDIPPLSLLEQRRTRRGPPNPRTARSCLGCGRHKGAPSVQRGAAGEVGGSEWVIRYFTRDWRSRYTPVGRRRDPPRDHRGVERPRRTEPDDNHRGSSDDGIIPAVLAYLTCGPAILSEVRDLLPSLLPKRIEEGGGEGWKQMIGHRESHKTGRWGRLGWPFIKRTGRCAGTPGSRSRWLDSRIFCQGSKDRGGRSPLRSGRPSLLTHPPRVTLDVVRAGKFPRSLAEAWGRRQRAMEVIA